MHPALRSAPSRDQQKAPLYGIYRIVQAPNERGNRKSVLREGLVIRAERAAMARFRTFGPSDSGNCSAAPAGNNRIDYLKGQGGIVLCHN